MRDPRPRQVGGFHAAPQTPQESVEVVRATLRLASGNGKGPRGTRASRRPGRRHRGRRSYGRTARAGERQPGRRGTSRARDRGGGVWPLPSSRRVSETARGTSQTPNGAEGRRTPGHERRERLCARTPPRDEGAAWGRRTVLGRDARTPPPRKIAGTHGAGTERAARGDSGAPWARSGQLSWAEGSRPTHRSLSRGRGRGSPWPQGDRGRQAAAATEESTLAPTGTDGRPRKL